MEPKERCRNRISFRLIDVLLVLIIIFMVITPTISQGLDTIVPQPSPPNQKEDPNLLNKTIVVVVSAGGDVSINQDKYHVGSAGPDALENLRGARREGGLRQR